MWRENGTTSAVMAGISQVYTSLTEPSVLPAVVLIVAASYWFTRRSRASNNVQSRAALPCFDDPTLSTKPIFEPSKWRMIRKSDSEFVWEEVDKDLYELPSPFDRDRNVNSSDFVFRRGLPSYMPSKATKDSSEFREAAKQGADYFAHVSQGHGCAPSDYGGPLFLLPGLIIAAYVSGKDARDKILTPENRRAMIAYILNHQQEDGGWGTHIAGTSTNFGSVLNYVAIRLLGVRATHPRSCKARMFLAQREGALGSPLWAKLWLAVLGCYDYRGVSPVPPEMWLLPEWFPFHPGQTWCHARLVALPMSYLYGKRFVYPDCETDATVIQLRTELYPEGKSYHNIDWERYGDHICGGELYGAEPSWLLLFGNKVLLWLLESTWLGNPDSLLRSMALRRAYKHVRDEDVTNNYIDIGPVNKALNTVCAMAAGDKEGLHQHVNTMQRYFWVAEDGMKMQGYLNSMVWDSSFTLLAVNAILRSSNEVSVKDERQVKLKQFAKEMNDFLTRNQVDTAPQETQEFRDPSTGGWGFSTKENTYIVSDCTAEALRAVLNYAALTGEKPKADVVAATDVILWMQNEDDGAWASYEKRRGHTWYELLNPAAIFGDIMIDYSYVECSSSCIQALVSFIKYAVHDSLQTERVAKARKAVQRANHYLFSIQRGDGSWFGQWGVCFTYATLFAVEAIAASRDVGCTDDKLSAQSLQRAYKFLLSKQDQSGGWGESVDGCALKIWVPDPCGANVVNTAWALLSLVRILKSKVVSKDTEISEIKRAAESAARFLVSRQESNGDWSQQSSISGVFNKTCGIAYSNYRNTFPIWALAEFSSLSD